MKVSELSQKSGVSLPTIKFYIREGLLPAGERTAKNQADYGTEHLSRLALIRSLKEDAGLGIESIARALRAADDERGDDFIVAALDALDARPSSPIDPTSPLYKGAKEAIVAAIEHRGWDLTANDSSLHEAVRALAVASRAFPNETEGSLLPYFDAVDAIAKIEIPDGWAPDEEREAALHYALLGTVLFEPFILALRRMAHIARTNELRRERRAPAKKRPPRKRTR